MTDALLVALGLLTAGVLGVGLGSLLVALVDSKAQVPLSTRFFLGVVAAFAILEPLHLLLPVAGIARLITAAAAVFGLWRQRSELCALVGGLQWWERASLVAGLATISALALGPGAEGDAALYHYPAVRWAASYAIVPGVGNLNPFLGYSHGNFLLAALLEAGPFLHRSHHLLNPLLVLVTGSRCLREAIRLFAPTISLPAVVGTVALLPVINALGSMWLISPSSNMGESMFVIVLVFELLALLRRTGQSHGWVVALLAIGAVVFKLSAALVAAAAFVLALRRMRLQAIFRSGVVGLLAGLGWLAGGAVRSGYLFYPMVFAPLPVDWRMDPQVPVSVARYISAYTKGTLHRLLQGEDDGAWWWPWLERSLLANDFLVPVLICVAAGIGVLWLPSARRRWWWLAPTGLGLVGWFLVSPDAQYLGAVLVLHTGLSLGLTLEARPLAKVAWVPVLVLVATVMVSETPWPRLREGGLVPAPQYPTTTKQIGGGEIKEPPNAHCGDVELPCAGRVEPHLRYRVPGTVAAGFAVRDERGLLPVGITPRWKIDRVFLLGPNALPQGRSTGEQPPGIDEASPLK